MVHLSPHFLSYTLPSMANVVIRLVLFLSSYAPLLLIVAIRNYSLHRGFSWSLVGLALLSLLVLFGYLRLASSLSPHNLTVKSATSKDGDAMSYIITYIFPFLDAPLNDAAKAASLVLLFLVLGILYVNSNLIYTNPILNLCGYHVFQIETTDGKISALITRRAYIPSGADIDASPLGEYVLLENKR